MRRTAEPHARRARTRSRRLLSVVSSVLALGAIAVLPGLSQCTSTCYDFDEQGNRIEFQCVTCHDVDTDPCSFNSWQLPVGSTCELSQRPFYDEGAECGDNGTPGICTSGVCEPTPVLAAGFGSTTWHAPTNPPGGGPSAVSGGCDVFVLSLNTTLHFETSVTLHVESDGGGNLGLRYDVSLTNVLLPVIGNATEFAGISLSTTLPGATPSQAISVANPSATGQVIGPILEGNTLPLSVARGTIEKTILGVTPTSFQDVNINWAEEFLLDFTLAGNPLFSIDETQCDFTVQGTGVDLPVGGCTSDAECNDGNTCTLNRCDTYTNRCKTPLVYNQGAVCDPGTGLDEGQCVDGTCRLLVGCSLDGAPINEGLACTTATGSGDGTCTTGACVSNDECLNDAGCAGVGTECAVIVCDRTGAPYVCVETGPVADGQRCGGSIFDVCDAGSCVPAPIPAAGTGSSTWHATTSPAGGPSGATGGCNFSQLPPTDVGLTMLVDSDGQGNVDIGYDLTLQSFLVPSLVTFVVSSFNIRALVEGAVTTSDPSAPVFITADGTPFEPLGNFVTGDTATIPFSRTPSSEEVAGALASSDSVTFSWSTFNVSIPPYTLHESVCTFDVQGAPVVLPLVQP